MLNTIYTSHDPRPQASISHQARGKTRDTMKRRLLHLLLHSVVVGLALATPPALPGQTLQELKEMVDELQKRIRILEEKEEKDALDTAKSREKSAAAPVISAGAGGFSLRSGDTNFVLKIRGYLQTD